MVSVSMFPASPLALCAALGFLRAGGAEPPAYRVRFLADPPASTAALPSAINAAGVCVGDFHNSATLFFDGVVWDADGTPTALSASHGFLEAFAISIRDDGTIVGGGSMDPTEVSHGIVIAPGGAVTTLPSLAGDVGVASAAFAATADGFVVGRSALVATPHWLSVPNDAVVWERGVLTSLGTLGGFFGEARDVNDARLVIGRSNTATSDFARGFVWDPVGGMREITPAEPGGFGHPNRLNEHGEIAGSATSGGTSLACRWPGPDDAPELLPLPAGAVSSVALAIDDDGTLVGSASTAAGDTHAMLWLDGAVHDLNALLEEPLPFELAAALDIAASGEILARGAFHPELGFPNVVLTPVPPLLVGEPATVSVGAGGAQVFSLDAGPDFAGELYVLLGSLSGTSPGLPVGAFVLPLNLDAYLLFTLTNANQAPLVDTTGVLDGDGRAQAALALPPGSNPALAGLALHHAYAVLDATDPSEVLTVSNAVPLSLVP